MKEQKGKKAVKPYDRQSPPAANRPLTPPTRDSNTPSPRVALTNGTRPASADWTQYDVGLNSATIAHDEELKTRKIPVSAGARRVGNKSLTSLYIPNFRGSLVQTHTLSSQLGLLVLFNTSKCEALRTAVIWAETILALPATRNFENSSRARSEMIKLVISTRSTPPSTSTVQWSLMKTTVSIATTRTRLAESPTRKNPPRRMASAGAAQSLSIICASCVSFIVLCSCVSVCSSCNLFIVNYFIPRAAFGHDTGSTEVFDLKGGRSRDRVIEYLLSICTGVIFRKKSVSSHCQTVRNLVGGTEDADPRRLTREYQSLAIDKGFTHDFPGAENPMMEDLEWMPRFYRVRKTAKGKDSEGRCPLILPPVIAAILDPATSASDIDLKRLRRSFDFSTWRLPEGLQRWWQKEQDEKAALKLAKEEEKRLREAAKLDGATTSDTATGPQTKNRKNALPDSSLDGSYPSTTVITPEYTSSQSCRDADDSDSIMQGVQLDEQSVRCYPRYYVAQCGPDPAFQEWLAKEKAARRHWEMMTRGDKFLRECSKSDTYTPPTNFHASSRPESNDYCNAESSANATAGPGPSTLENRARFFKGSKCWA